MSQVRPAGPPAPRSPATPPQAQQSAPTRPIQPAQLWSVLTLDQQDQVFRTLVLLCRALLVPVVAREVNNESL